MLAGPKPQHLRSPQSSPKRIRKRQRRSSPDYDTQVEDLSAEDLEVFDKINFSLSQAQNSTRESDLGQHLHEAPSADPESPFFVEAAHISTFSTSKTSKTYTTSFKAASSLPETNSANVSDWPASVPTTLPLFRSAKAVADNHDQEASPFADKENNGFLIPSKKALEAAQAKLQLWAAMDEVPNEEADEPTEALDVLATIDVAPPKPPSPAKQINAMLPPMSTPLAPAARKKLPPSGFSSQGRPFRPLTINDSNTRPTPTWSQAQPMSQLPQTPRPTGFSTPSRIPLPTARQTPKLMASTPRGRLIGISKNGPSSFASPFKSPLLPASAAPRPTPSSLLKTQLQNRIYPPAGRPTQSPSARGTHKYAAPPPRMQPIGPLQHTSESSSASSSRTLAGSGLRPQSYTRAELEEMGLNVQELNQMEPSTALHYSFYAFSSTSADAETEAAPTLLTASTAYKELLKQGCRLATEAWVNNHWCLVLWKLAGMAALDPMSEQDPDKKRWCWKEAMKQLRHRYDVELEGGKRPLLRQMVARDVPSTVPMVLCVSAVFGGATEQPALEVTDGWYRLRAEIDAPLARAVKRGAIRVGRKLAVAGAKLDSEKRDGAEILECGDAVTLKISGNSSSLAPWHAKLGAQNQRYISTLHSLTADGGVVSCVDIEVLKVHPVGYIEFVPEEDGRHRHVGPRNEDEEAKEVDKWERRREVEASKLRHDQEKRISRYMDYLSRLERKAEKSRPVSDSDEMPDDIMSYYDDLEEHTTALGILNTISPSDARWLAQMIRQNFELENERTNSDIERQLNELCPPRNVRNFRVVVVRDTRTEKRQSHRIAQLTVWDANSIDMSEGSTSGTFAVGQRYLVSNLVPTHQNAWMKDEPGAEIFMATRKDSRWVKRRAIT